MTSKKEIIIFEGAKGSVTLNADFENDTIWATENQVAEVFETTRQNINLHVNNVVAEGELDRNSTCKESLQVRTEGNREVKRNVTLYNLDMILSVGYRIKSSTATNFRIWATSILKQHLIQGYTINTKRLDELNKVVEILGRSENEALRDKNGALIIANNTLAAMTLMIALSKPEEKDIMCLLVMNMLTVEGEDK